MKRFLLLFMIGSLMSCHASKNVQSDHSFAEGIKLHRDEYKAEFLKDDRAPLKKSDFEHLRFYNAVENYKCDCRFEPTPEEAPFQMATYSGNTKPFRQYGYAICPMMGTKVKVHIYESIMTRKIPGYEDYLFIPFKDRTSGEETYGGGRYIDIVTGDINNNQVTIDFNKAYNPWCAYSDGYNCPVPPIENHFEVAIRAGEMNWTGEKKK